MPISQQRFALLATMKQGEYSLNGATIFLYKGETISDYDSRSESWDALVIPDGVTSIPDFYFQNLNIVEVFMADSVMEIGESVFSSCSFLQSIQFSRNLESIGYNAISNCNSLESIYIPHSCKMLGNYALSGCKNLMNIHVPQKTHLDVFTLSGTVRFQHDCVQASEVHSMFIDEYTSFCWREQEYFHFHEAIKNLDNTLMHRRMRRGKGVHYRLTTISKYVRLVSSSSCAEWD